MTTVQKMIAAALIALFWLAAIVATHFWPDIDVAAFIAMCASSLAGLGVHAAFQSGAAKP